MEERRVRLVILDQHGLLRASLARLLASESDLEVAGECGTCAEALEVLRSSTVDVILLDFEIGAEHGCDFMSAAAQAGYQGRFLILAGSVDVRTAAITLKLGASGIFLKSEPPDRLVQAIRLVRDGGIWVDQRIIQLLADQSINPQPHPQDLKASGSLEDRERKVLTGIVGGLSNRKIGENIGLSESRVKNLVQHLFSKAGVRTRSQLVRAALEGLLGPAHKIIQRGVE